MVISIWRIFRFDLVAQPPNTQLELVNCRIVSEMSTCPSIVIDGGGLVRKCQVSKAPGAGILVRGQEVVIEDTQVFETKGAAIEIREGGSAIIERCETYSSRQGSIVMKLE